MLQKAEVRSVRVFLNGQKAVFHEPHPERVTNKGAVRSVREFMINAGISIDREDEDLEIGDDS